MKRESGWDQFGARTVDGCVGIEFLHMLELLAHIEGVDHRRPGRPFCGFAPLGVAGEMFIRSRALSLGAAEKADLTAKVAGGSRDVVAHEGLHWYGFPFARKSTNTDVTTAAGLL